MSVTNKINNQKKYSIVVAHPDDEILWASSIVQNAEKIIICFTKTNNSKIITAGREKSSIETPKNFYFLNFEEPSNYGFESSAKSQKAIKIYKNLKKKLFSLINSETIYTHNPWGEYGHIHHIELHKIVRSICKEKKLFLKVFGYFHLRTLSKRNYFINRNNLKVEKKEVSQKIFFKIKNIYLRNHCWTWPNSYKLPIYEYFYSLNEGNLEKKIKKNFTPGIYLYFGSIQNRLMLHNKNIKKINNLFLPIFIDFLLFPIYYTINNFKRVIKKLFLIINIQ